MSQMLEVEPAVRDLSLAFFAQPVAELKWPRPHRNGVAKGMHSEDLLDADRLCSSFFFDKRNASLLQLVGINPNKFHSEGYKVRHHLVLQKFHTTRQIYDDYPKFKQMIEEQMPTVALEVLSQPLPSVPLEARQVNRLLQSKLVAARVVSRSLHKQTLNDPKQAEILLKATERTLSSQCPVLKPITATDYACCLHPELDGQLTRDEDIRYMEMERKAFEQNIAEGAELDRTKLDWMSNRADWAVEDHITVLHQRFKEEIMTVCSSLPLEYQGRVNDILIRNISNIEDANLAGETVYRIASYWEWYTQREVMGVKGENYRFDGKPIDILLDIATTNQRTPVLLAVMRNLDDVTNPLSGVHQVATYALENPEDFIRVVPVITERIIDTLFSNIHMQQSLESNGQQNYTAIVNSGMRYLGRLLEVATEINHGEQVLGFDFQPPLFDHLLTIKSIIDSFPRRDERTDCSGAIAEVIKFLTVEK